MKNLILGCLTAATIFFTGSCNVMSQYGVTSVAKFPIDEKPMVNTANAFLGDWKLDADADKKNFIRLEDYHAKFPDNVDAYTYHVQIWDRSGTNRTYEFNMYFSEVGNARFINVPDWMYGERTNEGVYILLEVISVSPANDKITAVPIIDPSLIQMKSSAQIRELITKNLNNPSFYGPEVNFNKVK